MDKRLLLFLLILGALIIMKLTQLKRSVVETMALAIQDWEDGVRDFTITPGSRSFNNNNPGNLRWFGNLDSIPWAGAMGVDGQNHVVFDSYEHGWAALVDMLELDLSGGSQVYGLDWSLYQYFAKYAEANTQNYAEFVAGRLGVSPLTTLGALGA